MMETLGGLLERGWRVRLISRVCQIEPQPGLRWIRIPTPRRPFVLAFPLFAAAAGLLLLLNRRRWRPVISAGSIVPNKVDIVTVQFCHAAFDATGILRTSRAGWSWRVNARVARAFSLASERWCYRPGRLCRMTAVSELVRDELRIHFPLASVSIDVIPNGVDTARFRPDQQIRQAERERFGVDPQEPVAVFTGGDWHRKGLDLAIDAVARSGWTLLVVGHGDAEAWGAHARKRGAKVYFYGHTSAPERALCAADAFILPSRYEGFALVTIEAAAAGLPLLVTEATGAAALAERAGIPALPGDPAMLAAELTRLGSNPDLRREIGVRARAAAEELTWPRIVDAYARAYGAER